MKDDVNGNHDTGGSDGFHASVVFPGATWEYADPEELGFNPEMLDKTKAWLDETAEQSSVHSSE